MAQHEGETEKLGFELFDLSVTLGPQLRALDLRDVAARSCPRDSPVGP
jgi:hypothetical protein